MHLHNILVATLPALAAALAGQGQPSGSSSYFYKGHDLSSLLTLEEAGAIYKDTQRHNETRRAEAILGDGGMNAVRLRLWVNPVGDTNGFNYTLDLAKRFHQEGYKLYLDYHFSDSWADPNKQPPPAAWNLDLEPLATTLRNYVKETLLSFHSNGIDFDIISLGNEIRHGILWPTGYVDVDIEPYSAMISNFSNLAYLWKSARAGVDDAVSLFDPYPSSSSSSSSPYTPKPPHYTKPQIMIHIDDGWNLTLQQRWFDAMLSNNIPLSAWDVFGFSFYPFYGTSATFANLQSTLDTLARRFGKPLHVVETDYPALCTGRYEPIPTSSEPEIPYSVRGQIEWVGDVLDVVREVPGGLGRGVWYWEPAWLNNTSLGSDCDDAILFSQDWSQYPIVYGYSRISVDMFRH